MITAGHAPHPGGMQHPGMPYGQPMGPGGGPHPGQAMGQGMQMHPGASGPQGPHVSQAGPVMGGMQPGMSGGPGAPNAHAHALQHLTPQAQQMFQHQQMQQHSQMMAAQFHQQQQHALFLRRQAMQQGMGGMNMQNGANPGMNPQQLAALQANNQIQGVHLTPHIRQQLAQQQNPSIQMQQQIAQQHAAQQAQAQAQAQAQQQHHLAMQHASSQQSNPSQQGGQGGPNQHGPQGQIRPPQQMSAPPASQASPAPQTPQPQSQGQPPPPQPPQAPQQPQPNHQAGAQQPQQPQQQQQGQNQQPNQPQMTQQMQQRMQMMRQQHAQQQAQQAQNRMSGATILKLLQFADNLSRFNGSKQPNNISHWRDFVSRFFADQGFFRVINRDIKTNKSKEHEICQAALPRYFYTHFQSGIDNIQVTIDGSTEKDIGNNCHYVEAQRARLIYWFKNGTQLICTGKLSALFGSSDKIEALHFETNDHQQYIPRAALEKLFAQTSPNMRQSPRMSKKPNPRNAQRAPAEPSITLTDLPEAPVLDWGTTSAVQSYLEIGETLFYMQDLMSYQVSNPEVPLSHGLENLVQQYRNNPTAPAMQQQQSQFVNQPQGPNPAMMQQGQQNIPPGARTPSGQGMPGQPGQPGQPQMHNPFMSPAMANMPMPPNAAGLNPAAAAAANGSPRVGGTPQSHPISLNAAQLAGGHTPSPAQAHMPPPNAGSAASSGASPNLSSKRRRSTVKVEGDDGVNGEGGAKVKQSPRMTGGVGPQHKRMKGS